MTPAALPTDTPTATVLVVEDDPGIAELERGRLEEAGYQAVVAATAEDALREVGRGGVDLVLLDYRLPGEVDGLEFYARVKAAGHDLPVILVTGFGNEATVIQALRIGVRDFVTKSLEYLDYLPEAVGRVLRQVGTERRLAESEARYRSLVETTNEWVWACDVRGRMVYNNPALGAILGYRPEELQGADTLQYMHDDDRPAAADLLARSVADRRGWSGRVFRWRHLDGSYRHLESNAVPLLDRRGEVAGFQGTDRDITDRLRLEDQVRQAQKMEAVGRLAGGVAHDFNNLLTVINGYSELLLAGEIGGGQARDVVAEIRSAGERAAALTQQLLAFSRKQILQPQVIDLNDRLREAGRMLRRVIGEDIALTVAPSPAPAWVRVDPGQADQVLLNLCVNARDAMPRGGTLTIAMADVEADGGGEVPPGRYVRLSVADTGCGMDEATLAHLFEPFFTTKPVGQGTGLGLATVYGIVRQSGGTVTVASAPGRGTTFGVYLPAADEAAPASKSRLLSRTPPGTGTVLVVEDEEAVRGLARLALSGHGYTVLEAADGEAAVRLAEGHPGPIHLLVTDVVMPRMGGPEVAERLTRRRPGLRVLYTSGYTDDAVVRYGVLESEVAFVQKPFTPATLLRRVRDVLESV